MSQVAGLEWMLAPFSSEEFAARYFGEEPLLVSRAGGRYCDGLLSIDRFEDLVFTLTCPRDSRWFHMTRNGRQLTMDPPLVDSDGDLVPSQVMASYYDGYTIILNQLHRRWGPVGSFCASLEESLVAATSIALKDDIMANAYLTPANSQGFAAHSDDHDVFVIQLEGSKRWRVYAPVTRYPLEASTVIAPALLERSCLDAELTAGSVLYVPRGFPHEASTSDAHSLHLTLGIYGYTYADLLASVACAEASMRRTLALDAAGPDAAREYVGEVIGRLGSENWLAAAARLAGGRLSRAFPASGGHLETINQLPALAPETVLAKRYSAAACRLEANDDHLMLCFPGCAARFPRYAQDILQFILAAGTFTVGSVPDLPAEGEKADLIGRLAAAGLLRLIDGEPCP